MQHLTYSLSAFNLPHPSPVSGRINLIFAHLSLIIITKLHTDVYALFIHCSLPLALTFVVL